jgi:hypothetical protein
MKQVTLASDRLWGAVNTRARTPGRPDTVGIAWFAIPTTSANGDVLGPDQQGYVTVENNNVIYPSIGADAGGRALMVMTLVGPEFFPSVALVDLSSPSAVEIVAAGAGPQDGFSGYPPRGNVSRWGDYSASAVAPDGSLWFAAEYIPALPRTELANWGTFIVRA